jgi:hypothetical protein
MKILKIIFNILLAVLIGVTVGAAIGVSPLWIVGGLLAYSAFMPKAENALFTSVPLFDLARPSGDNAGAGGGIDTEIILINAIDVDMANFPTRGVDNTTIVGDIPMKADKYMHRFYMTQGTIKPLEKKVKGANKDCGGYEVGIEGFYPGIEEAVQKWKSNFGFSFEGFVIIQNCSGNKKYLLGEPCNLIYVDDIETLWGEEVDKEKGGKFIFKGKQSMPMAIYSGKIKYDPGSSSW